MSKTCQPYELHQRVLLPADLREWLPEDHLAFFVSDGVDAGDLSALCTTALSGGRGAGRRPMIGR